MLGAPRNRIDRSLYTVYLCQNFTRSARSCFINAIKPETDTQRKTNRDSINWKPHVQYFRQVIDNHKTTCFNLTCNQLFCSSAKVLPSCKVSLKSDLKFGQTNKVDIIIMIVTGVIADVYRPSTAAHAWSVTTELPADIRLSMSFSRVVSVESTSQ